MPQVFYNNVVGFLSGSHAADATTMSLLAGHNFPDPGADYYLATFALLDASARETAWEIVRVTDVSGDTLTVVRGQEGTTGLVWAGGSRIEVRLTAGATESKANLGTAAYTASTAYAPAAQGVTNGNSHDHSGGDGGQIAYSGLSGLPTLGNAAAKDVGTGSTQVAAGDHNHSAVYQALDSDLTALAGLSTTGLIERTGAGTAAIVAKPSGAIVGTTDTQTLSGKTLADPAITGAILENVYTITDGAAFEIDPGNGTIQLLTLGGNRVPKATNFAAGESVTLMVLDGSTYTLTWTDATFGGSGVVWVGGAAPALDTTKYTVVELWKVGGQVYGALVGAA
jgi:hypothetical protein